MSLDDATVEIEPTGTNEWNVRCGSRGVWVRAFYHMWGKGWQWTVYHPTVSVSHSSFGAALEDALSAIS